MTDVVVLAAGLGRRLAGVTALPKWLTPVNETCPADAHLEAFADAGIDRVHVVIHPDASAIAAHVDPWRDRLAIDLVPNEHSADRNNWYSLLLGIEAWGASGSRDVAVVNSDLFADAGWFSALLGAIGSTGRSAALAIDPARGRTDEAMKVALTPSGDEVTAIGKVGIPEPGGEYVGLSWWDRSTAGELADILASFTPDPDRADHWYEHGIQCHLEAGAHYAAVPVPTTHWVEIDDERDLAAARTLAMPGGAPT